MTDVWGGGLVIAVAAVLWLAYLTPSWRRRREYLATERNAVRLQQTLRIMAETAETPEEVRVEANARVIAEQEKVLRKARKHEAAKARAEAEAEVAERKLEAERARRHADALIAAAAELSTRTAAPTRQGARRRRRMRAAASSVVLLSVIGAVAGTIVGLTAGEWLPLLVAAIAGASGVVTLRRLARPTIARALPQAAAPSIRVASEVYDHAAHEPAEPAAPAPVSWTPTPLPKPLHLERGTIAAGAMDSVAAAERLHRAARAAVLEARAAELEPRPVRLRPAAPTPPSREARPAQQAGAEVGGAAPRNVRAVAPAEPRRADSAGGRFARMGIVESDEGSHLDLDAALRRRRAV